MSDAKDTCIIWYGLHSMDAFQYFLCFRPIRAWWICRSIRSPVDNEHPTSNFARSVKKWHMRTNLQEWAPSCMINRNIYRSISKIRRDPCQFGASTMGASSGKGGFSRAHQTATISWSSIASLPNCSMISRVLSRKELVKCARGGLSWKMDGREGPWKAGSTIFLYSGKGSSWGVVMSRGKSRNRFSGRPSCRGVDIKSSFTAYGSAKKLTRAPVGYLETCNGRWAYTLPRDWYFLEHPQHLPCRQYGLCAQ